MNAYIKRQHPEGAIWPMLGNRLAPAALFVCLAFGVSPLTRADVATCTLDEHWTVDGFADPESAAIDLDNNAIYLSNVNGYALDGNGFISRVSLDGKTVEREWITGINSPTGVAIHDGKLYFADFNALVIASATTGEIVARLPAPDADATPVLNDVAIGPEGEVFVSGSRRRTIYKLADGALTVWHHDEHLLENANGLLVEGTALLHGGERWTAFDLKTADATESKLVPENLQDLDGIMRDNAGGLIVTILDDARLWRVTARGTSPLGPREWNGIDLDIKDGYLALPRVGGLLTLFNLDCEDAGPADEASSETTPAGS